MRKAIPWVSIILLTVVIALAGCGAGSSSPPTPEPPVVTKKVSGVAAVGAPMIGRAYLKDSSNLPTILGPAEIAADGSFSFDVTNLTAPFYLQAEGTVGGQGYKLHSVAMSDGTTNINPLTDLAVAAAAGVNDPAAVFNDPLANSISPTNLNKAIADIQAMLQPLLTAYSANPDFLSGSYTADNTGLDGLLDVVAVSINTANGGVSINDKITNTQIGATTTTAIFPPPDPISSSEANQSLSVPTDLQEVAVFLLSFATTFNKGSSLQTTDLDPYFAAGFGIDDGLNRTQAIQDWMESASGCDNCISSISGVSIKEKKDNGDYVITAVFYTSDGSIYPGVEFTVTKEDNTWKFRGNSYKSSIDIYPITEKYFDSNGKESSVASGIPDHNTNSLHLDGGTLSFNYIKPTAYQIGEINMEVGYWGTGGWDTTEKGLSPNETSASIVTLGLPDGFILGGGWLRSDVYDMYGRDITVSWQFSPTSTALFDGGGGSTALKSSIVGTWYGGSLEERPLYVFTFFANGTYMLADDDDSTTNTDPNNPICQPGIEHGIYTWDPATGAFLANPTITDTNGECGFSTGDGLGTTAIVTISGNILTMDLGDHGGIHEVTRLLSDANSSIVGTWYGGTPGQADNLVVLTFFTDSTYVQAQDGVVEPGIAQDGIELGTYTWNQETAAFTTSVPLADTIGEWGFNNVLSEDGVTVTINDDTLTITVPGEGIYTGTRLVP